MRVANPVKKSCTRGSFLIEGKSKGESYVMKATTKRQNAGCVYIF
jgi:hypothetical protein